MLCSTLVSRRFFKSYSGDHGGIVHLLQVVEPFAPWITDALQEESKERDFNRHA
jgi:hypothetical protein